MRLKRRDSHRLGLSRVDDHLPGARDGGPSRRKKRWIPIAISLVCVIFLGSLYNDYANQVGGSPTSASVTLVVHNGEGLSQFSQTLLENGVIHSSLFFKIWLRTQPSVVLDPGTYRFQKGESFATIVQTLAHGPVLDKLVIPDGLTLSQIAARVGHLPGQSASQFIQVAKSGVVRSPFEPAGVNSLEGLLYPDTYSFAPGTSPQAILQMMSDAFVAHAKGLGLVPGSTSNGLSAYQNIIIASIVEKEAVYPGDGSKVARVILNRLHDNMKLQLDSTVFYALDSTKAHLSLSDLKVDSPYNTYRISGLPPTPISLPAQWSISATLRPAKGAWLYYVVISKDGREAFSNTYAGQLANEKLAQSRGLS